MDNNQLSRLISLAQRTGDTLIVAGRDGEQPVVILPVDKYEEMMDCMDFDSRFDDDFAEDDVCWGHGTHDDVDGMSVPAMEIEDDDFLPGVDELNAATEAAAKEFSEKVDVEIEKDELRESGEEQFYLEPIE